MSNTVTVDLEQNTVEVAPAATTVTVTSPMNTVTVEEGGATITAESNVTTVEVAGEIETVVVTEPQITVTSVGIQGPPGPGAPVGADDQEVLYWDEANTVAKGSADFIFNDTLKQLYLSAGSAAAPSYSFLLQPDSGMFLSGTGAAGLSTFSTLIAASSSGPGKIKGTNGYNGWNSNGLSTETIPSGDGYAQYTGDTSKGLLMFGLQSNGDPMVYGSYSEISYAMYVHTNGTAYWYEKGAGGAGVFSWSNGDTLRVAIVNGAVVWQKNGVTYRTSTTPPAYPVKLTICPYVDQQELTSFTLGTSAVVAISADGVASLQVGSSAVDGSVFRASSKFLAPDGTGTYPSYAFNSQPTTGMYYTANVINWAQNGNRLMLLDYNNGLRLLGGAATAVQLAVKANATQTANLQEWQNSSGTALASVTKDGLLLVPDGSGTTAGIGFLSDSGTGFIRPGASTMDISIAGARAFRLTSASFQIPSGSAFGWLSGAVGTGYDTVLYRDSAGVLAQRNGTNAQEFRVYGSINGADKDYLSLRMASGEFKIAADYAGAGGVKRDINLLTDSSKTVWVQSGGLTPYPDNTPVLGTASYRWKSAYISDIRGASIGSSSGDFALVSATASRWLVKSDGMLVPFSDATFDLGSTTSRVRDIFASSSVRIGSNVADGGALRFGNAAAIYWRDAANTANTGLIHLNSSNNLQMLTTTGNIVIQTSGAKSVFLRDTQNALYPGADADLSLGTAASRWSSGYFGGVSNAIPVSIKLHASQTANALEVQNSSGTALAAISGVLGQMLAPNGTAANPGLGFISTAGLGFYNSSGVLKVATGSTDRADFSSVGIRPGADTTYNLGAAALRWKEIWAGGTAASVPLTAKLHASQTANALEIKSSADAVLSRIKSDGRWRHDGATTWDDLRVEPVARTVGANAPSFEKYFDDAAGTSRGVYLYSFDDAAGGSEKEIFFNMQMPHNWYEGSELRIHVHWVGSVADTTATPRWGLEYTIKDVGQVFGDTTTVYGVGAYPSDTAGSPDADIVAGKHYVTPIVTLTPDATFNNISAILIGRLFRDSANAADTYNAATNKCGLLYVDCHYQVDSFGSDGEYTKG